MSKITKYRHIREELQALQDNINIAVSKLADSRLSAAGVAAAEELVKTLNKVKLYIQKSEDEDRVNFIISKLPLLYFQIPKIN